MKLYFQYDEGPEAAHMKQSMKLKKKWRAGPTINVKETFVESYNSKHPDTALDVSAVHLVNKDGLALSDTDVIEEVLTEYSTVRVKHGASPTKRMDVNKEASKKRYVQERKQEEEKKALGGGGGAGGTGGNGGAAWTAFDHSKWDRLDLSDDDGADCHPNIDKASWVRLMGRQRDDRRDEEEVRFTPVST